MEERAHTAVSSDCTHHRQPKHFYTSADEWEPIHAFAFVVFHFSFNLIPIYTLHVRAQRHTQWLWLMNRQQTAAMVCECACDTHSANWVCGYARIHICTRVSSFMLWAFVLWFLDCRYTQRRGPIIRRSAMAFFLLDGGSNYSGFCVRLCVGKTWKIIMNHLVVFFRA